MIPKVKITKLLLTKYQTTHVGNTSKGIPFIEFTPKSNRAFTNKDFDRIQKLLDPLIGYEIDHYDITRNSPRKFTVTWQEA